MAPSWWPAVKKIMDDYGVPMEVWVPIMWGESRGNPRATNDTRGRTDLPAGTVPEFSVGLFQVNLLARKPNATPAELEAYAEQLRDPETNASLQGQRIATAWNALKGQLASQPPETWAPAVAVRSGHPGGSVDHPCVSDWCKRYQASLGQRAANMIPLIQQGLDFFGADWSGRLQGAAAGALAGAGATNIGSGVAGAVAAGAGIGGSSAVSLASGAGLPKLNDFLSEVDWFRVIVFMIGLGLFLFAAYALLTERITPAVGKVVRVAAKAVDDPAETVLDMVGD